MGNSASSPTRDDIAHEYDELDLILSVLPQLRKWISQISARYEPSDNRRQLLAQIFTCTLTVGGHLQHWQAERQVDLFRCEITELATCLDHIFDDDDLLGMIHAAQASSQSLGYSYLRSICNTIIAETDLRLEHLIEHLSDKHQGHWAELLFTLTNLNDRLQNYQSEDWVPEESFANLPDIHTNMSQFINQASTALFCEHSVGVGSDLMLKLETYKAMDTESRSLCVLLSQPDKSVGWREIYIHNQEDYVLQDSGTNTSSCVCEFLDVYAAGLGARIDIGLRHNTLHTFLGVPNFDIPNLPTDQAIDLNGFLAGAKQNLTIPNKWSLAMRFTYGLLYLYESSKDKNIWTKNNIVFFGDHESDPLNPFFKLSAGTGNLEHSRSRLTLHQCSESLNLGIMLLELHMKRSIDDYLGDGDEIKTTNDAYLRSWKVFQNVEATIESGAYRNAIWSCLHNGTFANVDQNVDRWREIFFRNVIRPLELEMTQSITPLMSLTNFDKISLHPNKPISTIHGSNKSWFHDDNDFRIQERPFVNGERAAKTHRASSTSAPLAKKRRLDENDNDDTVSLVDKPDSPDMEPHLAFKQAQARKRRAWQQQEDEKNRIAGESLNRAQRAPFSLSGGLSPQQENMMWADRPRYLDSRSTGTLADSETHRATNPAGRFLAMRKKFPIVNNIDTKEFATVLDDQEQTSSQADSSKTSRAMEYLESLRIFNNFHIPISTAKAMSTPEHIIKICVIDTGLDMSDSVIKGKQKRVLAGRSWVGTDPLDTRDTCGHGTHIGRLILGNTANSTCLLVAKVTNNKDFNGSSIAHIVEAFTWARDQGAHIISLSLGFHRNIPEIQKVIETAVKSRTLIFAAAGNWGLNRETAFPARENGVFCINASDGKGSFDSINPDAKSNSTYTTLGVSIPSRWQDNDIYVTGTSFATPIAAAIAATVLNFARHRMDLDPHDWGLLASYQGMRKIFDLISVGQNRYLTVTRLEDRGSSEDIGEAIQKALTVG